MVALAMLVANPGEMWFGAVPGTGDTLAALGIEVALTATMLGTAYLTAIPLRWPLEGSGSPCQFLGQFAS